MATAEEYASWIVANKDKQGTPEFETVANAYQIAKGQSVFNQEKPKTRSWGDVPLEAITNLPSSLGNVAGGVVEAVSHPVDTAKNLAKALKGGFQNVTGLGSDKEAQAMASGIADFYKQRYGSEKGFKEALATDPAGVMADAASVFGVGGAAKIPGLAKVASSVDPLVLALRGGKAAVSAAGNVAKQVLGKTTGVGSEAIGQAYKAGASGNKSFADNMRGNAPMTDVLDTAKADLDAMNKAKQAEYRSGMVDIKNDRTVLDFSGIDNALSNGFDTVTFKGHVKNQKGANALSEVQSVIDEWRNLDPAEFHTPEGMDALKQKIGAIQESIPLEEKTARKVVGDIYNSIKSEISNQAPAYSKVMKDYAEASEQIKEIERALSLGQKASADTAMRKLQSLMRNNVNTNYGNRLNLAKALEQQGGQEIMPALAGQAMSEWTPRGIQGATMSIPAMMGYSAGGLPMAAGVAATSSPRLVGEAAYGAGQIAGALRKLPNAHKNTRAMANALYQSNQIGNK